MTANKPQFTPGPWQYVPATEHHGPYITSEFGNTIADCYVMSEPSAASVLNGGPSRPILFLAEMADPNARLMAASPALLAALYPLANEHTAPELSCHAGICSMEECVRCSSIIAARAAIKLALEG